MANLPAKHVAEAAVKAAKANHYLVGLVNNQNRALHIDYKTYSEATQIIYELENSGKVSEKTASIALHLINRARE